MGELPAFDFRPSPHRPLVIMSGYSEAGRVYPHDGVRSKEETKAIQNLWMASGELFNTLEELRQAAALLQQNAEGCAINHYGEDFEIHGMPGWLADTAAVIEKARVTLAKARGEA